VPNPPKGLDGVLEAVGKFAKGLLASVGAGVLRVAAFDVPKRLVDGAGVAALSAFCPNVNGVEAGAVAVAFGVPCALVPNPPNMLF
jgi:hypothetical protein